jgi:hypothetical protein
MQAPKNMNAQRQSQNLLHPNQQSIFKKIKKKKKKKKKKQENVARNKTTSSQTKK